ncbi:MAG: thymidine kinase [Bacilli bacterium]|nr:thymidine kinase [Bacilli bacterium]
MAKLYFRYGAMNCGKTTAIIQVAYNYEEKGRQVLLIKPSVDTKGADKVINRCDLSRKVDILLKPDEKVSNYIKEGISAILIDEAQFLNKEQVDELYAITKTHNIPVLCYGLRCDFRMEAFPGASRLLAIADDIEELKTICECGKKATQNLRLVNGKPTFKGDQVAIDGENKVTYESVCGACYLKYREEEQQ